MQPEPQQCIATWQLVQGHTHSRQRRHCKQPGTLLLAHINSSILQQQQSRQQPWVWPWLNSKAEADVSPHVTVSSANAATNQSVRDAADSSKFCDGPGCHPSATDSLLPGINSSTSTAEQHVSTDKFQLPNLQMQHTTQQQQQQWQQQPPAAVQQPVQQQLWPPSGAHFASATFAGNGSSRMDRQLGSQDGPPMLGLRSLQKVINSEAGKLVGILGAQLLFHAANLQRGLQALQQHQQGHQDGQQQRLPWRPRLPWQRQQQQQEATVQHRPTSWQPSEAAKQWVSKGIAAETRMDLREALACYTNAVTLEPGNVELLCRMAKQWSDLTYEDDATIEHIQEVNDKAIEYAERAISIAPKSAGGHMASCVSRGRLALFSDNKTKVRLAKEAQEAARTALALEPDNDLAHHLMGRWHYEMAQINFVVRQLIKFVYGAALAPGKYEDALMEFQTAVNLNPNRLIHRVELGRSLMRVGQKREAYEHLTAGLKMPVEDINAQLQKEDGEQLLKELQGEFDRSVSWGGFTPSPTASVAAAAAAAEESSSNGSAGSTAVGSSPSNASGRSNGGSSITGGNPGP